MSDPSGSGQQAGLRSVVVALAAVALCLTATAAVALVVRDRDDRPLPATGPEVRVLGPAVGEDVAGYLEAARYSAEVAEGPRLAVVSFVDYLDREVAADLVAADDLRIDSFLVAVPGAAPERTDDVDRLVRELVADAASQAEEIELLLPTVDDEEFAAFYRAELVRYRSIQNRASGPVVFGAVVVGRAPDLRALASRPEVRAVEVALGTALAADATVRGLLPEERTRSGAMEFRPA